MEAEIELIIRGCQTADPQAQRALYEALKGHVQRFVVRLVPAADVADITCEVFVRIFQSINGLRSRETLFPQVWPEFSAPILFTPSVPALSPAV